MSPRVRAVRFLLVDAIIRAFDLIFHQARLPAGDGLFCLAFVRTGEHPAAFWLSNTFQFLT